MSNIYAKIKPILANIAHEIEKNLKIIWFWSKNHMSKSPEINAEVRQKLRANILFKEYLNSTISNLPLCTHNQVL